MNYRKYYSTAKSELVQEVLPPLLFRRLKKVWLEKTSKMHTLEGILQAAVEMYLEVVERPEVTLDCNLNPILPEPTVKRDRKKSFRYQGNEERGQVISLLPYLESKTNT